MTVSENDSNQPKPHVLVVDDEREICQMVMLYLQKNGYDVSTADNADMAYYMLEMKTFDAIVSDVMMPGQDGITFLGRVHRTWPEIPVVIMTGYAQLQMAVNAIKNGAFDFIHKPFDFDHLRKIVERAIDYTNLKKMDRNYRAELEETVVSRTAELKNAMTELDFAKSELLRAATDKSNFMSNISHEMRTPINGIVGALDLLSEEGVSGVQAEYLAMARQSAEDMVTMINQLLSFNNGTSQYGAATCCNLIDFRALLNGIIEEKLAAFTSKGLSLSVQISDDIPSQIWINRENLSRLIEILLDNSLKFTEKGGVKVVVTRQASDNDDDLLLCSVTDSGIGIPEGMLHHIFDPFVQGDGSFTRRYGGVGLGLSIARQNILLLNGNLWAEHAPDGGSSFKFSFKIITPYEKEIFCEMPDSRRSFVVAKDSEGTACPGW